MKGTTKPAAAILTVFAPASPEFRCRRFAWAADEGLSERANPVFASGPGFALAEQMILAATAQGLSRDLAEALVTQPLAGSARMLPDDARGAADLLRRHIETTKKEVAARLRRRPQI